MSGCSGAIYLVRLPNDGRRSHLGNPDADFASRERKNATPKDGIFTLLLAPRPGLEPGTYGLTVRRSTN